MMVWAYIILFYIYLYTKDNIQTYIVGGGEKKMTEHKFRASISHITHTHSGAYYMGVRFLIGRLAYGHAKRGE